MTWFQVALGLAALVVMLTLFVIVARWKHGAVTPPIPPRFYKAADRNSKGGFQRASEVAPIDVRLAVRCHQAFVFRRLGWAGGGNRSVQTLCDDDGDEHVASEWTWGPVDLQ